VLCYVLEYRLVKRSPLSRKTALNAVEQKSKINEKSGPQIFLGGGEPGSVARLDMIGTLNLGPHAQLELSGPCRPPIN